MTILNVYEGKSVVLTGDSGFKGSWLAHWLVSLGAKVTGISLPPDGESLFESSSLSDRISHKVCDIRDYQALRAHIEAAAPDFIFHLAAQSLVRKSYEKPRETFETNVGGTLNVLESIREIARPCVAVIVTTDKCYENREWEFAYRENDAMGGHDPYSASKGCVEVLTASYNRSFFLDTDIRCASARAGNVIGPGDWAKDRIVPDLIRAVRAKETLEIRNPVSIRPWQHVLEPLSGYLVLGARMASVNDKQYCTAYNFGPRSESAQSVENLVQTFGGMAGDRLKCEMGNTSGPHEAKFLKLAIDKAIAELGWAPLWDFEATLEQTWNGYIRMIDNPASASDVVIEQVEKYMNDAEAARLPWAV